MSLVQQCLPSKWSGGFRRASFLLLCLLSTTTGTPCLHLLCIWQVSDPAAGVYGAGAHSDYGMLTILATDRVPGLQIHLDGSWHDVAPVSGAFIINLGDMLERCVLQCFTVASVLVIVATASRRAVMHVCAFLCVVKAG